MQNRYLDFLIDPSFQGVNRIFVNENENEFENHLKMKKIEKVLKILSSNCRNKKLQCYDRWKKF